MTDQPTVNPTPSTGVLDTRPVPAKPEPAERPSRRFLRRLRHERGAVVALAFLAFICAVLVLGPLLPLQDPNAQDLSVRLSGPTLDHWFGTDGLGRDHLARLVEGGQISLMAGVEATAFAVAFGIPSGLIAGFFSRRTFDTVASQAADAVSAIPSILLALAVIGALGRDLTNAMLAIGIILTPQVFRVTRSAAISVSNEVFIQASRSMGARNGWLLLRHVVPNTLSPILVRVTLTMSFAMLSESGISFLGLGAQPPDDSWGSMLARATVDMRENPWLVLIPGLLIFFTVVSFNTLGDGLARAVGREAVRR